jgi:hypothetical protein
MRSPPNPFYSFSHKEHYQDHPDDYHAPVMLQLLMLKHNNNGKMKQFNLCHMLALERMKSKMEIKIAKINNK